MGGASFSTLYAMATSGASAGYVACSYVFNNTADYNTTGNSTNSTTNPNFNNTFATDSSYLNLQRFYLKWMLPQKLQLWLWIIVLLNSIIRWQAHMNKLRMRTSQTLRIKLDLLSEMPAHTCSMLLEALWLSFRKQICQIWYKHLKPLLAQLSLIC